MQTQNHSLNNLFAQLGLAADDAAINLFIDTHKPIASNILLYDAPFWTNSQATFLREEILNDADWAEVIDQLNARLHAR